MSVVLIRDALIRDAQESDWPFLEALFRAVVSDGRSIAWPEDLSSAQAQRLWLPGLPQRTVVAVDADGRILGSALMGANRPGRGSHIATATFMVDEAVRGRGVGRALGEHVLAWARDAGHVGIQFNAVVETNAAAVHLWTSLGMRIVGTVPHAFRHPDHGLVGLHIMFQHLDSPDTATGEAEQANHRGRLRAEAESLRNDPEDVAASRELTAEMDAVRAC